MSRHILLLLLLCGLVPVIPARAGPPAPAVAAKPAGDMTGTWQAQLMGQPVTVRFTQDGNLISGLLTLPDVSGATNTYHLSGTIVSDVFATVHGSGHMLRGRLTGPDQAEGELILKDAPPVAVTLRRMR